MSAHECATRGETEKGTKSVQGEATAITQKDGRKHLAIYVFTVSALRMPMCRQKSYFVLVAVASAPVLRGPVVNVSRASLCRSHCYWSHCVFPFSFSVFFFSISTVYAPVRFVKSSCCRKRSGSSAGKGHCRHPVTWCFCALANRCMARKSAEMCVTSCFLLCFPYSVGCQFIRYRNKGHVRRQLRRTQLLHGRSECEHTCSCVCVCLWTCVHSNAAYTLVLALNVFDKS